MIETSVRQFRAAAGGDQEAAYRQYIADLILSFATDDGSVDAPEAYRRVSEVTGRTISTVKNWLSYCVNLPDLASMGRIVAHWNIPAEAIFPRHLDALLAGMQEPAVSGQAAAEVATADQLLVPLLGGASSANLERALLKYTDQPRSALFVRHEGSDMMDQVRPGELLLIDASVEEIRDSGIYYLRYSMPGQPDRTCVRNADVLLGEPVVRLTRGSAMSASGSETLTTHDGHLPRHISVLGRVIGVVRQT